VPLSGDGTIVARVVDNGTGSNAWAKGGVMIRETLDADSKHSIMALTGGEGGGITFQGRPVTGERSNSMHGDITAAPPYWVKLTRAGNTFTAYHSADGVTWELFTDTVTDGDITNPIDVEMAEDVYIGLFVTSHQSGEIRTYTFDNVSVALPEGWQSQDIGTTGGSAATSEGTWTISADGADIWGNSDQFHYVYREMTGDVTIEARVVDNGEGSNAWAKGGVMIRQSLDADSINVSGFITGGSGDGGQFQWRPVQGEGSSSNRTLTGIAPPYYVRLVREGDTFTVFLSPDGVEWAQQGAPPAVIEMTDPVLIGLAVTSHQDGEVRTFTFDNVRVILHDVTAPGDAIQGVPNDGDWPGAETPDLAIDDDIGTKYLHFKGETETTGFQVTPSAGPTIVTGLTFTTANDAPERDPIAFELSGSNESIDGPYELIASGDIVDFAQEAEWPRFTMNSTPISFDNDVAYAHYQVLFPAVRDPASANSMQIAEVELLGELYVDPDIAAINELYNQATLACGTGDVELYLSIFTEDTVVMAPGFTAFIGKDALRLAMEGLFGMFDLGLPYTVDEVGVLGDWAFVRSSFQYSMTPKEGGETTTNPGEQLDILKRQADGSWKIYLECWNYDAPLPAPEVAATSEELGIVKLAQVDDADAMYREMCDLYKLAAETGDVDLYVDNYTADGVQMPPEAPTRIGSEQIRAAIEPALTLFDIECPIYPKEAVITGDWAFGWCDWSLSLTPKEGGQTTTFDGKGLDVIKRQADGSWKYYIECWNYNGPPIVEE